MKHNFCVAIFSLMAVTGGFAAVPEQSKVAQSARKSLKTPTALKALPAPMPLADLSAEHLAIAERVVLGPVACELGAKVTVRPHPSAGRFEVLHGRQKFQMEPSLTSTGAVRLEDPVSGAVWLQLGNKSMLLNQRHGQRLADACVNGQQALVASALEQNKGPGLLDDPVPSAGVSEVGR